MGVGHAIWNPWNLADIKPLEVFGREIIPEVVDLGSAARSPSAGRSSARATPPAPGTRPRQSV
jgi:hypothetical protein